MASPTQDFFEALSRRGHDPLLERITAKVYFNITDGAQLAHWLDDIENRRHLRPQLGDPARDTSKVG